MTKFAVLDTEQIPTNTKLFWNQLLDSSSTFFPDNNIPLNNTQFTTTNGRIKHKMHISPRQMRNPGGNRKIFSLVGNTNINKKTAGLPAWARAGRDCGQARTTAHGFWRLLQ
jgi:hypothetical protein